MRPLRVAVVAGGQVRGRPPWRARPWATPTSAKRGQRPALGTVEGEVAAIRRSRRRRRSGRAWLPRAAPRPPPSVMNQTTTNACPGKERIRPKAPMMSSSGCGAVTSNVCFDRSMGLSTTFFFIMFSAGRYFFGQKKTCRTNGHRPGKKRMRPQPDPTENCFFYGSK